MSRQRENLIIFSLLVFCFAIRLAFIWQKNMWFDEIYSWHITQGTYRDIVISTAGDIHPPFYYFVLKFWQQFFGYSPMYLRGLSAVFSAAAAFFIYPISKRILNTENSLLVIFLYAISPLNIYFAQEARMASLNLFLNAGSVYFLILLSDKTQTIRKFYLSISFYFYTLFTLLALYTQYFSFLILAAEGIYLLYHYKKDIKKVLYFIPSFLLIAWGYSPWFDTMIWQIKKGQSWRGGQTPWAVIYQFLTFIKDIGMGFYHRYINNIASYTIDLIIISIIVLAVYGLIKLYKQKNYVSKTGLLIVLLVSVPFLAAIIISFKHWIEYFRYLSIIIPYVLICVVFGLQYYSKKIQNGVIITLVLINLFGVTLYFSNESKNNDYIPIINALMNNTENIYTSTKKDELFPKLYVYPHYFGWSLDYYSLLYKRILKFHPPEDYGWEFYMLKDTVLKRNDNEFLIIMDYHSPDSLKYSEYLQPILNAYDSTQIKTYHLEPNTVKLYRFERKK